MHAVYDKSEEFRDKCVPLLEEVKKFCEEKNIPFYWTACVASDEESCRYESDVVGTGSCFLDLADDRIIKHLAIGRGFDAVPSRKVIEINMDDIVFDDEIEEETI